MVVVQVLLFCSRHLSYGHCVGRVVALDTRVRMSDAFPGVLLTWIRSRANVNTAPANGRTQEIAAVEGWYRAIQWHSRGFVAFCRVDV